MRRAAMLAKIGTRGALVLPFLLLPSGSASAGAPASITNAKITLRPIPAGGLAAELRELSAAGSLRWVGWAAPVADREQQMCCFGSVENWSRRAEGGFCCGSCSLEKEESFGVNRDSRRVARLEDPASFHLLLRVGSGGIQRIRSFSADCGIDAGGMPLVWLEGVSAPESVAYLGSLVSGLSSTLPRSRRVSRAEDEEEDEEEEGKGRDRLRLQPVVLALAQHGGPEADRALERLVGSNQPLRVRKEAAFWLGSMRGRAGYDVLEQVVVHDPDPRLRQHGTLALAQSGVAEAVTTLIGMARRDPDGEVRGQALFWLAQKAGRKAAGTIEDAIRDDPDTEVKRRAVFALTQMPDEEGVTHLIRVARTNRNAEVRRQAIFWLGQSKDPRAFAFIEEILAK